LFGCHAHVALFGLFLIPLGNEAMKAKDYETAVTMYSKALELSPNGPNSHIFLVRRSVAAAPAAAAGCGAAAGGGILFWLKMLLLCCCFYYCCC
jgi:hypothetical protein